MRSAGAATLAQDEASSVVWGMPRAAIELHAAEEVVTLDAMSGRVMRRLAYPKTVARSKVREVLS